MHNLPLANGLTLHIKFPDGKLNTFLDFSKEKYYYQRYKQHEFFMNIFKEVFIMKTVQISLNSIGKVKSFVNTISQFEYDFDLISGRYVIDAKSIMGIFSLDLSKPIDLAIHTEDNLNEILEALKPYIIFQ